ncbi:MAG TPA: molybdenum cofactor guanylyltransferase MobA [Rhodanobacteraceae bacterium]
MTRSCLGVVLAGGAGSRVGGADKGLLLLQGRPLVAHVLDALHLQCDAVLVVANRNLDEYSRFAKTVRDESESHAGPLAGIVAALTDSTVAASSHSCEWLLTVPVDCPHPPEGLRERLQSTLAKSEQPGCAFVHDGDGAQPLFALYRLSQGATLLGSARAALRSHASVLRWQVEIAARAVDFSDQRAAFHNLNTPQDFSDYERA